MAEVLGTIASGIAIGDLAVKLGTSIKKLRGYWEEVKEAPSSISFLIRRIELTSSILTDIEHDQAKNPFSAMILDTTTTDICLQECRLAIQQLEQVVEALAFGIESKRKRKRWEAAGKFVLKKDDIQRLKDNLEGILQLITISQGSYSMYILSLVNRCNFKAAGLMLLQATVQNAPGVHCENVSPFR